MLKKIAILIVIGIFSVSIAGCGHLKRPFKKKHWKNSELQLNMDVNHAGLEWKRFDCEAGQKALLG